MNEKVKYLNLLVLSTFLVGQVQYAYSTYFCTMMQQPVSAPAMKMNTAMVAADNVCEQCQAVTPTRQGTQLNQGDCVKLITSQKSTLDYFTDSQKSVQHFVSAAFFSSQLSTIGEQPLPATYNLLPTAVSPPQDLPTLNSNLRI